MCRGRPGLKQVDEKRGHLNQFIRLLYLEISQKQNLREVITRELIHLSTQWAWDTYVHRVHKGEPIIRRHLKCAYFGRFSLVSLAKEKATIDDDIHTSKMPINVEYRLGQLRILWSFQPARSCSHDLTTPTSRGILRKMFDM